MKSLTMCRWLLAACFIWGAALLHLTDATNTPTTHSRQQNDAMEDIPERDKNDYSSGRGQNDTQGRHPSHAPRKHSIHSPRKHSSHAPRKHSIHSPRKHSSHAPRKHSSHLPKRHQSSIERRGIGDLSPVEVPSPSLSLPADDRKYLLQGGHEGLPPAGLPERSPTDLPERSPTDLPERSPTDLPERSPTDLPEISPTNLRKNDPKSNAAKRYIASEPAVVSRSSRRNTLSDWRGRNRSAQSTEKPDIREDNMNEVFTFGGSCPAVTNEKEPNSKEEDQVEQLNYEKEKTALDQAINRTRRVSCILDEVMSKGKLIATVDESTKNVTFKSPYVSNSPRDQTAIEAIDVIGKLRTMVAESLKQTNQPNSWNSILVGGLIDSLRNAGDDSERLYNRSVTPVQAAMFEFFQGRVIELHLIAAANTHSHMKTNIIKGIKIETAWEALHMDTRKKGGSREKYEKEKKEAIEDLYKMLGKVLKNGVTPKFHGFKTRKGVDSILNSIYGLKSYVSDTLDKAKKLTKRIKTKDVMSVIDIYAKAGKSRPDAEISDWLMALNWKTDAEFYIGDEATSSKLVHQRALALPTLLQEGPLVSYWENSYKLQTFLGELEDLAKTRVPNMYMLRSSAKNLGDLVGIYVVISEVVKNHIYDLKRQAKSIPVSSALEKVVMKSFKTDMDAIVQTAQGRIFPYETLVLYRLGCEMFVDEMKKNLERKVTVFQAIKNFFS